MKALRFHPEAERELVSAQIWYEKRSEVAAQAFALELDKAIHRILESPQTYPMGRRGERRFILERFPYTILYRTEDDDVFVTAVAHHSRRPDYWRHR